MILEYSEEITNGLIITAFSTAVATIVLVT